MEKQKGPMKQNFSEKKGIKQLILEIKQKNGLGGIDIKELLKPDGYAKNVVDEAGLKRVQLRKIFSEFKIIKERYEKGETEKVKKLMYKLYPIIQYQCNRKLISENFRDLMFVILESLENNFTKENFEHTFEFMEALVAYIPRDV